LWGSDGVIFFFFWVLDHFGSALFGLNNDDFRSESIRESVDAYVESKFGFCWENVGKSAVTKEIFKKWLIDGDFASLIDFVFEAFKGLGLEEQITVWNGNKMLAALPNSWRFLMVDKRLVEELVTRNQRHVCLTEFESKAVYYFAIWEPERDLIIKNMEEDSLDREGLKNFVRRILTSYYEWADKGFSFSWLDSRVWPQELWDKIESNDKNPAVTGGMRLNPLKELLKKGHYEPVQDVLNYIIKIPLLAAFGKSLY
jgi:hypothetical protein